MRKGMLALPTGRAERQEIARILVDQDLIAADKPGVERGVGIKPGNRGAKDITAPDQPDLRIDKPGAHPAARCARQTAAVRV